MYFLTELCCQHLRWSYRHRVARIVLDIEGRELLMNVSGMLPFLIRRPESAPPSPNFPRGNTVVLKALPAFPGHLSLLAARA